ncbi:hypothetical protein KUTeg_012686 [Tegillarca granosa]|uniref:Uncharacterized protein n=1 Tax=Tegillarca granosa TaxID=220873 RepID=A0ABQ9F083_TEGGR|nr:hypothetical protein KUTeg_012686 [Tegillarca granosa]
MSHLLQQKAANKSKIFILSITYDVVCGTYNPLMMNWLSIKEKYLAKWLKVALFMVVQTGPITKQRKRESNSLNF